jgi:uncharacterized tellurite resistance protein B-like protein
MLNKFKQFFEEKFSQNKNKETNDEASTRLAAAALLIEIAYADSDIAESEKDTLKKSLHEKFKLSLTILDELVEMAEAEIRNTHSTYEFTRLINEQYNKEQKYLLIQSMWEIAYADGTLNPYEEAMIRKLADLLYVPHGEFIRAKINVMERL